MKRSIVQMGLLWSLIGAAAVVAASCGGSGGSTLSPSNVATISSVSLSVNPPGVGANTTASGSATLSNGNVVAIATGYTSDAPLVATITGAGVMTGVSIGDVTISLDYQGFHATKRVRVLPNYNGIFSGTYTIDSCTDTGGFADAGGLCGTIPAGSTPQIALNNAQSADLTTLTGQFALGGLVGNSTGTIASNGALTFTGAVPVGTTTVKLQNFAGMSPAIGEITGHFEVLWTDTAVTGQSLWVCTIQTLSRSSGGAFTASRPSRRSAPETLADLVAAVRAPIHR